MIQSMAFIHEHEQLSIFVLFGDRWYVCSIAIDISAIHKANIILDPNRRIGIVHMILL